jgi:tRNA-dihydrouridine synthase A
MTISPAIPPSQLRLSVAPMMDWTDTHCRVFHRHLAPHARLYTEMVHANAVIHGDRSRLLALDPVEHPVALQLGGSEPALLAQAAQIGAAHGFDEINLNCGCPSDRVQAGRFGACLMREPQLVADSVAAMVAALEDRGVDVPVTIKCRLGVDDDHDWGHFLAFIDTVAAAGCRMFVVHARNAGFKGSARRKTARYRRCATTGPTGSSANVRSCRSSSTAASPRTRKRRSTWSMPTARCSGAPPITIPTCCIVSTWPGSAAR